MTSTAIKCGGSEMLSRRFGGTRVRWPSSRLEAGFYDDIEPEMMKAAQIII